MQTVQATSPRCCFHSHAHVSGTLMGSSHVFVRHDAVRKPLQQPYDGLHRSQNFFTLDQNGKQTTVSIDHLKPAHLDHSTGTFQVPRDTSLTSTPLALSEPLTHFRDPNSDNKFRSLGTLAISPHRLHSLVVHWKGSE